MKKLISFIICILWIFPIYGNEINNYEQILIETILTGNKPGQIGDTTPFKKMGGVPPNMFTISNDNLIYVCDFMNQRINIYILDFSYKGMIKEKQQSESYSARKLNILGNGNIVFFSLNNGIVSMDQQGNEIFRINYNILPNEVRYKHIYFIIEDNILYYNNEQINIIDQKGKHLDENEKKTEIERLDTLEIEHRNGISTPLIVEANILLKAAKIIKYKDRISTGDFKKLRKYYELYNSNKKTSSIITDKLQNIFSILSLSNMEVIGYDTDSNSYWKAETKKEFGTKQVILVCSKFGAILDCFYNEKRFPNIAIAPKGDVYFMDREPKDGKFLFYKVERRW